MGFEIGNKWSYDMICSRTKRDFWAHSYGSDWQIARAFCAK